MAILRAFLVLVTLVFGVGAVAAQEGTAAPRERFIALKTKLDQLVGALERPGQGDEALLGLRRELDPIRNALIMLQGEVAGPRDAARARVERLGPAPKDGEPPEAAEVADARKRETATFTELDSVAREIQLEITRADQAANRITQLRREQFTRQLTEQGESVLDPAFWTGLASDLPRFMATLSATASDAALFAWNEAAIELPIVIVAIAAAIFLVRLLRHRMSAWRQRFAVSETAPRRFVAASDVVLEVVHGMIGWPLLAFLIFMALDLAGLLHERFAHAVFGPLVGASIFATLFDTMGRGVLEVDRPALRLVPLSTWAVRRIARRVRWCAVVIFFNAWFQSISRELFAPISVTVALTAVASLAVAAITVSALMRLRAAPLTVEEIEAGAVSPNPLDFLRPILWLMVIGVVASLVTGFVALAGFIGFVTVLALFAAVVVLVAVTLVDSGLTDGLAAESVRGRAIANAIGVSPNNVAFAATLLSGLLRFVIIASVVLVFAGPLGFYSADLWTAIERAFFGFQIGEITISLSSILTAVMLFIAVIVLTRMIRSWVGNTLLPRTTLDAGLQNSIATVVGYSGGLLAIVIALSEVGIDLQSFAIVAGALSVGIGFGLQSIVSNFVSGLILLAERPIRVGDVVSVKGGEEGHVRRISVRATEIETYDRATIIVPNTDLITGVVKNWVYGNASVRVRTTLKVGYESDVDLVRRLMIEATADDPRILPSPRPRVHLTALGDTALEFELVAVIASVEASAAVRSDLHMRIVKAFRDAGVRMAGQQLPFPVVIQETDEEAPHPVNKPTET